MYPTIDNPQNYTAGLYLRLSKEDVSKKIFSNDSESIKNQRTLLEGYAKDQHIAVYDIYTDDGFSGTSDKRPDFERMLDDIEKKHINMVITKDMSRLSRNYIDSGYYMELLFPEKQIRYISLLDGIDTGADNYTGDLAPFKAIINDMYAKDISKKITSVKRDKQQKGLFIGAKAPYGYKKSPTDRNKIVIDEPAAEIVKRIFTLASKGKSCREIAILLNEENIPSPAVYADINLTVKGSYTGKWSAERISFMLQNEVYLGSMVQGRVRKVSYKSKKSIKLPRDEWKVVEHTHEPIVDKETFDRVAKLIKSRYNTRYHTYDFILKGLIFCNECKKPLGVCKRKLANGREVLYFICRTYQRFTKAGSCTCHCVRVDEVTELVMNKIRDLFKRCAYNLDFNALTSYANIILHKETAKQSGKLDILKTNLSVIKIKIDKAYNDKLSGHIDEDDFKRIYTSLKNKERKIKEQIKETEALLTEDIVFDSEKTKSLVEAFLNTDEYERALLVNLIDKIELSEGKELNIYFKFKEPRTGLHLQ